MRQKIGDYLIKIVLFILGCSFLFPLFWMLNLSFKSKSEVYNNPFGLPQEWVFSNYGEALKTFDFFKYLNNSFIYTLGTALITIFLGSMLAYCVSRMQWRFADHVILYLTMGLIIPVQVVVIPLYMMIDTFGLKGSRMSLILPYASFALASCVLMLNAFFRGLPKELEEAASIDGCNVYQCFFQIILPIVKPALATQFVLIFMSTWNEFFLAFILAGKESLRPLPVGLLSFFTSIGVSHWGLIGAAMIMCSIPTVIVYCFGNKQIENSLTAGAVLK
ncbi:MAG: binding-protein-dependent transport system inner rane component [Clostridia bacterium]|nr:binding-protein-dependent transport system inner rane component [Clostridia bacterium]